MNVEAMKLNFRRHTPYNVQTFFTRQNILLDRWRERWPKGFEKQVKFNSERSDRELLNAVLNGGNWQAAVATLMRTVRDCEDLERKFELGGKGDRADFARLTRILTLRYIAKINLKFGSFEEFARASEQAASEFEKDGNGSMEGMGKAKPEARKGHLSRAIYSYMEAVGGCFELRNECLKRADEAAENGEKFRMLDRAIELTYNADELLGKLTEISERHGKEAGADRQDVIRNNFLRAMVSISILGTHLKELESMRQGDLFDDGAKMREAKSAIENEREVFSVRFGKTVELIMGIGDAEEINRTFRSLRFHCREHEGWINELERGVREARQPTTRTQSSL